MMRSFVVLRTWCSAWFVVFAVFSCVTFSEAQVSPSTRAGLVVYAGTPAGIMASVAAARRGESVILVEPNYLVGGVVSGGLTKTDIGRRETIGGLTNEFFSRVLKFYADTYGKDSEQVKASNGGVFFEPHVAQKVFDDMLREAHVRVLLKTRLESVSLPKDHIDSITVVTEPGGTRQVLTAAEFIDASYEGDLMAASGVPYRVGREGAAEFGESLAGLNRGLPQNLGQGDQRVQSYNIRSTITNRPDLRLPFPKPEHYMPDVFREEMDRLAAHHFKTFEEAFQDAPHWGWINGKADPNKADDIGTNITYSDGDAETRRKVYEHARDLWLTYWYMLQNDPAFSSEFRANAMEWGLPKDEFLESGHVTPQLYVREARRMIGRYIMSQKDVQTDTHKPDGISIGSYGIDSHPVQRILTPRGYVFEGNMTGGWTDPYEIPYRSITPYAPDNLLVVVAVSATHIGYASIRMEPNFMMLGEAGGLAADLAIKGSTAVQNIPVDQLRTELKQSGVPLQAPFRPRVDVGVDTPALVAGRPVHFHVIEQDVRSPLRQYFWNFDGSGKVEATDPNPEWTFPADKPWEVTLVVRDETGGMSLAARRIVQVGQGGPADVEVSYEQASVRGHWQRIGAGGMDGRGRMAYQSAAKPKETGSLTYLATVPVKGKYLLAIVYPEGHRLATNVPIHIFTVDGEKTQTLDERQKQSPFCFSPIGEYRFEEGMSAKVVIETTNTDGDVAAGDMRWIWLGGQ